MKLKRVLIIKHKEGDFNNFINIIKCYHWKYPSGFQYFSYNTALKLYQKMDVNWVSFKSFISSLERNTVQSDIIVVIMSCYSKTLVPQISNCDRAMVFENYPDRSGLYSGVNESSDLLLSPVLFSTGILAWDKQNDIPINDNLSKFLKFFKSENPRMTIKAALNDYYISQTVLIDKGSLVGIFDPSDVEEFKDGITIYPQDDSSFTLLAPGISVSDILPDVCHHDIDPFISKSFHQEVEAYDIVNHIISSMDDVFNTEAEYLRIIKNIRENKKQLELPLSNVLPRSRSFEDLNEDEMNHYCHMGDIID